ncbi:MAG: glycoside hydrolase family 3 C-terminal domain-containing protein [Dorea sp.]|nr:glycoside hydrolase family 3 C-terminal domain-containing protein [Dorea sp.]
MGNETDTSRKQTLKAWKKDAKKQAAAFLKEKRSVKGPEKKALKTEQKKQIKAWKKSLKSLPKEERKDQKKAFKAYKKRLSRRRRTISWGVVIAIVLAIAISVGPIVKMFATMYASQQYTTKGPEVDAARAAGYALSAEICDEGYILLKNDDSLLPLEKGAKVNVFGDDAYNFVYGGSGSAGADQSGSTGIFEAMEMAGLEYNPDIDAIYRGLGLTGEGANSDISSMVVNYVAGEIEEGDWHLLTDEAIKGATSYSDTAMLVLSSMEVEGSEVSLNLLQPASGDNSKAEMIRKVCETFDHVIVIINSGNVMELKFMEDYPSVDAAVWVGSPGSLGCIELMKVLTGEVNPSGRTVDTWPVSIEKEPGFITYGNNTYDNLKDTLHVFTYNEGIYVGYRYYETWFEGDESAYWDNVVYPFGHGLSYTTFEQKLLSVDASADTITANVKVTNTGKVAGKDVVELYFMAPWNAASGIEKSAIELAGFAKTSELAPGASETVSIDFKARDMSSYSKADHCYVLEAGDYKIAIGKNVHDAATGKEFQTYKVAKTINYTTDDTTGTEIRSLFDYAQGDSEGIIYMSRADKEGTFPVKPESYTASDTFKSELKEYEKFESDYSKRTEAPVTGADNGIMLSDLKGLDFDDPKWEEFLDQFTTEELIAMQANGGWHTVGVARLGVPGTTMLDGPSGINSMMKSLGAVAYPMETVISSSWNTEMAYKLGIAVGDESNAYGVHNWYAPAMNIHRTSIGGRNNEYYSEDPMLAGAMAAETTKAIQSKNVVAVMKHFVCNDVELNARSNVTVWVDQQALREIYLRPFEVTVKDGGAAGAMSSFSRLGAKWCGGSSELLKDLLRDEWGFRGYVSTDACLGGWMNAEVAAKNGNDLMLEMGMQNSVGKLNKAVKADPIGMGYALRDCAHDVCYAIVNVISK